MLRSIEVVLLTQFLLKQIKSGAQASAVVFYVNDTTVDMNLLSGIPCAVMNQHFLSHLPGTRTQYSCEVVNQYDSTEVSTSCHACRGPSGSGMQRVNMAFVVECWLYNFAKLFYSCCNFAKFGIR